MAVAKGLIVPKNRMVGSDQKVELQLNDTKNASGASGANSLVGCIGFAQLPFVLQHLEYQYDNEVSGSPVLYIGKRRQGDAEVQDVIDDPEAEFTVLFAEETLAGGDANTLQAVDLTAFTDEELTLVEGDELIAVMRGETGAWTCVYPRIGAMGRQTTPTNSI